LSSLENSLIRASLCTHCEWSFLSQDPSTTLFFVHSMRFLAWNWFSKCACHGILPLHSSNFRIISQRPEQNIWLVWNLTAFGLCMLSYLLCSWLRQKAVHSWASTQFVLTFADVRGSGWRQTLASVQSMMRSWENDWHLSGYIIPGNTIENLFSHRRQIMKKRKNITDRRTRVISTQRDLIPISSIHPKRETPKALNKLIPNPNKKVVHITFLIKLDILIFLSVEKIAKNVT
jgi:hypothetical protein